MPVLEGYANADTPHAKTVMAPGWTYGCAVILKRIGPVMAIYATPCDDMGAHV